MWAHLQYLWYVLRHKWHVSVAGRVLDLPRWRLLTHDLSKFSPAEWGPYVRRFYGGPGDTLGDPEEFDEAWRHHWQRNPHHPEYWTAENAPMMERLRRRGSWAYALLRLRKGMPALMPDTYIREMVADWYGAGMAQGKPDCWAWYRANRDRYPITEEAHAAVERYLLALTDAGLIPWEHAGPDPDPSELTP